MDTTTIYFFSVIISLSITIFVLYSIQEIVSNTRATRKNTSQAVELLEIIAKKQIENRNN